MTDAVDNFGGHHLCPLSFRPTLSFVSVSARRVERYDGDGRRN
jgi:hypothetical protein